VDFHDEMLVVYRLSPDPAGSVLMPGGWLGRLLEWIGLARRVPRSDAVLMRRLSMVQLLAVAAISRDAMRHGSVNPKLRCASLAAEVEAGVRGGQAVEIGPVGRPRRTDG
jgi:hypothetical protein